MLLEKIIENSVENKIDFSNSFSDKVKGLKEILSINLDMRFEHDSDMNYSASQKLFVRISSGVGEVKITAFVSSRGPLFTIVCHKLIENKIWNQLRDDDCDNDIRILKKEIVSLLESKDLYHVQGNILNKSLDGYYTDLDGKPATLFEILFSELN